MRNKVLILKLAQKLKTMGRPDLAEVIEKNIDNPELIEAVLIYELEKYMSKETIFKAIENMRKKIEKGDLRIEDYL